MDSLSSGEDETDGHQVVIVDPGSEIETEDEEVNRSKAEKIKDLECLLVEESEESVDEALSGAMTTVTGGGSSGASGTVLEASARVKQLAQMGALVEVDHNVPPRRYFRSGLEMVRMANVYLAEGSLENAYILYLKFMTLFVEKIRKHPEYASVPAQVRAVNQSKLKEVMPKAEKLKQKLLDQYTKEHIKYLEDEKRRAVEAEARVRKQRQQEKEDHKLAERLQADEDRKRASKNAAPTENNDLWTGDIASAPPVDSVLYPDDWAAEPPRAPAHHYNPAPPLIPPAPRPSPYSPTADTYSLSATTSGRLRTVVVPSGLMQRFLALAAANTAKNVESCGILAGLLERDQFKITHVVIPKQSGTADSCTTSNEEEIFHFQDLYNLITLGWIHIVDVAQLFAVVLDYEEFRPLAKKIQMLLMEIRLQMAAASAIRLLRIRWTQYDKTHPTQTAFLSSVDLHTQCSYQLMLPEAIAIVCAPKYNETGYFALTPSHGMQFISNCRQSGFHPHPNDPPLFYNVTHIRLEDSAPLEVIDLRG